MQKTFKRMRTKICQLIVMLLMGTSSALLAQVPTQKELWKQYDSALQADIKAKQERDKRIEEERKQAAILISLDSIRNCLRQPYSVQSKEKSLKEVEILADNPDLKEAEKQVLNRLKGLIENYQVEANKFIAVFAGEITDSRYVILVKREADQFIPSQVKNVLEMLRGLYDKNGLTQLAFDADYEYLNDKLSWMKTEMENLMNTEETDGSKLYDQLVNIVKLESELSEEHKTYREFK